jgi:hypothetical protein
VCLAATFLLAVVLVANGKLLATLSAARCQYATAILCSHALAETMLVHAAAIVWLKCSFHCNESFYLLVLISELGCKITIFFLFTQENRKK